MPERPGNISSESKANFMDKLKGGAKIISGKLGRNEEKIEEGRAMKLGGTPVPPTAHK